MSAARGYRTAAALALLAAAAVCPAGRARAQALPFEAVPFGGALFPMGKLVDQGGTTLAHRTSVVFGGRLDAWLWHWGGLELAVTYAPSGFHATNSLGQSVDTTGGLFAATGRVVLRFARTGPVWWHVSAGGGVVIHSGTYLANLVSSGRQSVAGVVGLTGRFQVSEGTALVLTAESYLYSAKFSGIAGVTPAARFNSDVAVSLGVVVPLGARGEEDDYRVIR